MSKAPWSTPPGWLKLLNKVNVGMQRLGIPAGPVPLLTVRGRSSGQPRTTPVTPFIVEGQRYLIGGFAHGDWVANARANPYAVLRHGRRTENVRLIELPEADRGPIMRAFPTEVPRGVFFFLKTGAVEDATPEAFERGAANAVVFRIQRP